MKLVAVMVQLENILAARWHPEPQLVQMTLAFCTGTPRVYFWSQSDSEIGVDGADDEACIGCSFWIDLPAGNTFAVTNLKWNSDGTKLCLLGRDRFCTCDIDFSSLRSQAQSRPSTSEFEG